MTRHGEDVEIITERDVISKIITTKDKIDEIDVKAVMSKPLVTIDRNTVGEKAIRTMVQNDVRRLPVTDEGRIVGMFTTSDVTKLVTMSMRS